MGKGGKSQQKIDTIGSTVVAEDDLDVTLRKRYKELAEKIGSTMDIYQVLRKDEKWFGDDLRGYFRVQNLQAGKAAPKHVARAIQLLESHTPPTLLAHQGLVKK